MLFPKDPLEPRLIAWVRNPRVRRTLILSVLWTFIAVVLITFHTELLPFGLAVLLSFILEPLVTWLCRVRLGGRQLPRVGAVIFIYLGAFVFAFFFGRWALVQLGREVAKIGTVSAHLVAQIEPTADALMTRAVAFAEANNIPIGREEIQGFVEENLAAAREALGHNTSQLIGYGQRLVGGTVRAIFGLFLVLMLTAFLSIDRERIQRFFHSLVPPEYQGAYRTVTQGMNVGLAGVVRGQVLICLTNGAFTFVGLWLLGVKLPVLLATIATVFSLIPIFGSILSTIPIVVIALTDSLAKGLFALLWIIGIHLVEANLLNPKIMGDAAKIHPLVVVFALIVGERTAGLMGALFAVPITSVLLTLFKYLHGRALQAVEEAVHAGTLAPTGDLPSAPPPISGEER